MSKPIRKRVPPRYRIDITRSVTPDEALELMVHHLSLAAAYYEVTVDNDEANEKEIRRLLVPPEEEIINYEPPVLAAALGFYRAILRRYNDMNDPPTSDKPN